MVKHYPMEYKINVAEKNTNHMKGSKKKDW